MIAAYVLAGAGTTIWICYALHKRALPALSPLEFLASVAFWPLMLVVNFARLSGRDAAASDAENEDCRGVKNPPYVARDRARSA